MIYRRKTINYKIRAKNLRKIISFKNIISLSHNNTKLQMFLKKL